MRKIIALLFVFWLFVGYSQEHFILGDKSVLTISGTSTVHDWKVDAISINGSLERSSNRIKTLIIKVPVLDIKSERGATMDAKMHKALKSGENPEVIFSILDLKHNLAKGNLVIAGTTNVVEVEVMIVKSKNEITIKGTKEVKLQDYGMEPPTAMFGQIIVGDIVTVNFDLVFVNE